MFKWIEGNLNSNIVTINANNITLNKSASSYFQESRYVSVGIDVDKKELAIHPVTKSEIERNTFTLSQLHKISHGSSYTRISNKALIDHISEIIQKKVAGEKYDGVFDEKRKMLIIDLTKPLKKGSNE